MIREDHGMYILLCLRWHHDKALLLWYCQVECSRGEKLLTGPFHPTSIIHSRNQAMVNEVCFEHLYPKSTASLPQTTRLAS